MTHPIRKIAFVSPHCVLDFTNGAATATRDGLGEDQGQTLTANWISGKVGPGREKRFGVDAPDFAGSWTIRIADSLIIVLSAPYRFV